jgi:DNA-binding transcriptional ArsR family regulator
MVQLIWDVGTAYDLFVSLDVLHFPTKYKVPGAWSAGMRARLSPGDRDILEQSQLLVHVPLSWIRSLPGPKDGASVLWTLGQTPPAERLPLLGIGPRLPPPHIAEILLSAAHSGKWDEKGFEAVLAFYQRQCEDRKIPVPPFSELVSLLKWWLRSEEFGIQYLQALRHYYLVFFEEEERRIQSSLEAAVVRGQELASRLSLFDLLEELSQGLRLAEPIKSNALVLAPSYWSTPLVFMGETTAGEDIWLFGARTPTASLVPGEMVPDTLLRELDALSDPTRLRILQYLSGESLAPAQLARRLRLRTPTVMHHLQTLRLAGLVQLTLGKGKEQRTYATRPGAVGLIFSSLQSFLLKSAPEGEAGPSVSEETKPATIEPQEMPVG